MKRILKFSIFILGFSAMSSQIVFLREFLVTFYGNEFSLGLVLSSWLFSGVIGSLFLGKFTDRLKKKGRSLFILPDINKYSFSFGFFGHPQRQARI